MPQPNLFELTPEKELTFPVSLYVPVQVQLKIKNVHDGHIAFKVKTTAPNNYVVKPSSGSLNAGETVQVAIAMRARSTEPPRVNSDRFLVQAVQMSSAQVSELQDKSLSREMWSSVDKSKVQDKRLNVVFKTEAETAAAPAAGDCAEDRPVSPLDSTGDADLKSKYDEIVEYARKIEKDNKTMKSQLGSIGGASAGGKTGGYPLWQMILAMILAVVLSKLPDYLI